MYRIEQALVPLDFSSFSRSALAFARSLGGGESDAASGLQLGHAVESMPPYIRSVLFPYAPLGEDDRQFEAELVQSVRDEMSDYFQFDDSLTKRFIGEPFVEFGSSKQCIADWSSRLDADMVVLGAFGRHGVFAGGPGSTSRRVASVATVPVALIRDYEPAPTIDRVLAAVDLGEEASKVIDVAAGLAVDQNATLELMHVIPEPFGHDTDWRLERHLGIDRDDIEASVRPACQQVFDELVEGLQLPFERRNQFERRLVDESIHIGDPACEIAHKASDGDFNLVVVGSGTGSTSGVGDMGRVASAVIAEVARHLVVVPSGPRRSFFKQ